MGLVMSALPFEADIWTSVQHVRLGPEGDIRRAYAGQGHLRSELRALLDVPKCSGCSTCSALSFNALCYVACHRDRAKYIAFGVAFDNRKGHLDVQPASALV
jgi:hypothetical protein